MLSDLHFTLGNVAMSCAGTRGRDGVNGRTGATGFNGRTGATGGAGPLGRTGATGRCSTWHLESQILLLT